MKLTCDIVYKKNAFIDNGSKRTGRLYFKDSIDYQRKYAGFRLTLN